jgi:hypothetical protein
MINCSEAAVHFLLLQGTTKTQKIFNTTTFYNYRNWYLHLESCVGVVLVVVGEVVEAMVAEIVVEVVVLGVVE